MAIELLGQIGTGGFGTVYEALLDEVNGLVAVKQLRNPLSPDDDLARFKREVRIQSKLRHENILPIIVCDLDCNEPWFASPLAQSTLVDEIATIRFQPDRVSNVFRQILEGMRYAHENNVIHRDLKPENILIFAGDNVKIADFGLGKILDSDTYSTTLTHTNQVLGTLHYMAPEQMSNLKSVDGRSDIYSLGKLLYAMLTGEIPFPALDLDLIEDKYRHIVSKCTEIRSERRYQTMAELLKQFDTVTDDFQFMMKSEIHQQQIEQLLAQTPTDSIASEIMHILLEGHDDRELYYEFFPKLAGETLSLMLREHSNDFEICLKTYDEYVNGALAFEYCDVVADFYEEIFTQTQNTDLRSLILKRLLILGASHNRWHVQGVFCRLLSQIRERATALYAVQIIDSHPHEVATLCRYLRTTRLIPIIANAVDRHCSTYPVDDLPF